MAIGYFDERSLVLVEQNAIHAGVERIRCVHCDGRQVIIGERFVPDIGDAAGDGDVVGQSG